ncbi:MAG: methyltransferase domain-containing protein [Bryobacteraceae bacterium]
MNVRFACAAFLAASFAFGQVAEQANSGYRTKEGRDRVASSLARPSRDERQKPQELVDGLGLKPGQVVADIGTGIGYMLPYLSRAVGPSGRVYAEDIHDDFLEKAEAKAKKEKLSNVSFVKGIEADVKLAKNSIDMAFALDAYHHMNYPEPIVDSIHRALKLGGRFVVVDFYKREGAMGPGRDARGHIRADQADVIREVEARGFKLTSKSEHLKDSQYVLVFKKK